MKFAKKSSYLTACLLALVTGSVGVFAYSPFDYWFIAYLSACGLIYSATHENKRLALLATFVWSLGYFCVGVNWIHVSMIQFGGVPLVVSYLAVLLLASYLGLFNLLFSWVSQKFSLTNPFVLASLFTFTEYLRGTLFTGFPWLQFGYSQIDSPFTTLATIFGVEGLTFFVMLTSGYLVQFFRKNAKNCHKPTAYLALAIVLATPFIPKPNIIPQEKALNISLVQGNIEQKMKWDPNHFQQTIQTYSNLIKPLLGKSDLIVLPESAIPAVEFQIQPLLAELQEAGSRTGSEIIIGTLHRDDENKLFNSAVVLGNAERPYSLASERYNKHHLVPFGEYVPFGSVLDWMREVFVLPVNLSQGDFIQPALLAKQHKLNMAICYEIIFGHQVQQNQKAQQADYLLTISNDAWFGESIGPWQHFQMARMRALELGKPLIRSTNTGVTAFVDHTGKVTAQLPQFEANSLTAQVYPTKGETLFAQWGIWLLYSLCAAILLLQAVLFRQKSAKTELVK